MFNKKPAADSSPVARSISSGNSGGSTFSVLGSDTTIVGDIKASADLHLDGRIEGDISCTSLVQGESSEISGSIEAETARLAGSVTGSVSARELVVLASARITGDVSYDTLTIEEGAMVDGKLSPRGAAQSSLAPQPQTATPSRSDEPAATERELRQEPLILSEARAN